MQLAHSQFAHFIFFLTKIEATPIYKLSKNFLAKIFLTFKNLPSNMDDKEDYKMIYATIKGSRRQVPNANTNHSVHAIATFAVEEWFIRLPEDQALPMFVTVELDSNGASLGIFDVAIEMRPTFRVIKTS